MLYITKRKFNFKRLNEYDIYFISWIKKNVYFIRVFASHDILFLLHSIK